MILSLISVMKTKNTSQKELASRILEKITEALEGVDAKAVKKVKRSAQNTATKLAKKFASTLDKIARKEETAAKKSTKKSKKDAKKSKAKAEQSQKVATKKDIPAGKPAKATKAGSTPNPAPPAPSGETSQE